MHPSSETFEVKNAFSIVPQPRGAISSIVAVSSHLTLANDSLAEHADIFTLRVVAVGVNFRDVLNVLGMYPGDPGPPGADCAGVAVSVSPLAPRAFHAGESLLGLAPGCLGSHARTSVYAAARKPDVIAFSAAATTPTVFVTVDMALSRATEATPESRVLVQATSGGVGLAALEVLRTLGAHVVGTAGGPRKRALLRDRGVCDALDTRRTAYADEIHALTRGEGVTNVLNSLTSTGMVAASLSALGACGGFVEIGKRDIWTARGVHAERCDVSFHLVAVDFLPPPVLGAAFDALVSTLSGGVVRALPSMSHTVGRTRQAFVVMARAQHVGKVVVQVPSVAQVRVDGSWLVTGGLGMLGLMMAGWLREYGAAHEWLVSRSGRARDATATAASAGRCMVQLARCDVSQASEARWVVCASTHPPTTGVLHAGGVLRDAMLLNQSASRTMAVHAPKVCGAAHLRASLAAHAVDTSVLFSSIASLLGNGGQANYVSANAALDSFAHHSLTSGVASTSAQWGAWSGGGMASQDRSTALRLERMGMGSLDEDHGLSALHHMLKQLSGHAVVTANPFDWSRFLAQMPAVPAFVSEFEYLLEAVDASGTLGDAAKMQAAGLKHVHLGAEERKQQLERELMEVVRGVVGPDAQANDPLMEAGLDSLGAVELKNAIDTTVGIELPGTLVFDYPSVTAMVDYIDGAFYTSIDDAEEIDAATAGGLATSAAASSDGVCRMSVLAVSSLLPSLFQSSGFVDAITEVPHERWDVEAGPESDLELKPRFGSYLRNADQFDIQLFGLTTTECSQMDGQQRVLLLRAWEVTAGGVGGASDLRSSDATVAVGISAAEYGQIAARYSEQITAYMSTGSALSVACGRLSYTFGMQGSSVSVDTACSSSLVVAHIARTTMAAGQSTDALVCGVNLTLTPGNAETFNRAGMLAPDGRCKTLDAKASGYVRGESCGVLRTQMSTVHDATMPHDDSIVHVAGSSVNQDGRSSALTAPNGPSQQRAIRIALQSASMPASGVHNLQMHGTGTPLGDPIEVGGSFAVLVQAKGRVSPLVMSAAKSAVGHTEPGAGAVGLLQVVHDLRTTSVAPVMHLTSVNPHMIGVLTTPAYAFMKSATQLARDSATRVASGVSSFAFQGTNAHVIGEQVSSSTTTSRVVAADSSSYVWRMESLWIVLKPHHLVGRASAPAHGTAEGAVALRRNMHAYLWDHRVQGQALFPGAGFFETAAAFGAMLRGGAPCALTGVSIPMPLALPDPSDASFRSVVIACSVSCANSAVSISSSARMTHIRGIYAQHRSLSRDEL